VTAAEIKAALRRRHPALSAGGFVGEWTCLEEFHDIDLLAFSAWSSRQYRRVGYEVKVSRADYRRELLKPYKRVGAVAWCHEFFFAVPDGLLSAAELEFVEPEWQEGDFARVPCPNHCRLGKRSALLVGPLPATYYRGWAGVSHRPYVDLACERCEGRGYLERSRVEREAPTLWVPRDVGLVVVRASGKTRVARPAPKKPLPRDYKERSANQLLADLVRHASARPDPRHAAQRSAAA
jgi:hypothetical protein